MGVKPEIGLLFLSLSLFHCLFAYASEEEEEEEEETQKLISMEKKKCKDAMSLLNT